MIVGWALMVEQTTQRDVTVPLLNRIISESLDQDYRQLASRHTHVGKPASARRAALFVVTGFGLLLGTSAIESARSADEATGERSSLIAQIESRRDRVTGQQQQVSELRAQSLGLEAQLESLAEDEGRTEERLEAWSLPTGFSRVRGPGLRITVADAPDAEGARLLRADDLAILLDGLWNAGAEAVAINDQRVTTLTSLRNSGLSVGVNRVALSAPYTLRAIGDPGSLQARLLDSTSGLTWQSLVEQLGFRVQVENVDEMVLPAAQLRMLRAAQPRDIADNPDPEQEKRS